MSRKKRFTFRVNEVELQLIKMLAVRLARNQSDVLRYIVREAAAALAAEESESLRQDSVRG